MTFFNLGSSQGQSIVSQRVFAIRMKRITNHKALGQLPGTASVTCAVTPLPRLLGVE